MFLGWIGDHGPRHVHVYRDGTLVVKWDLENWQPMKGTRLGLVSNDFYVSWWKGDGSEDLERGGQQS